jgi:hypothetical protein
MQIKINRDENQSYGESQSFWLLGEISLALITIDLTQSSHSLSYRMVDKSLRGAWLFHIKQ